MTPLPLDARWKGPMGVAAVGGLIIGASLVDTVREIQSGNLNNGFWAYFLVLVVGGGIAITHRAGAPMYTLPVPVAAIGTTIWSWEAVGPTILIMSATVAAGTSLRAIRQSDVYGALVPPALTAVSGAVVLLALAAINETLWAGTLAAPLTIIIFSIVISAYSLVDTRVGYWLRQNYRIGRPKPLTARTYAEHFLLTASTAISAGVVTYVVFDWDVIGIVLPILVPTAIVAIVAVRGLPGTSSSQAARQREANSILAATLTALGDAETQQDLADIVATNYPVLFASWDAHLVTGQTPQEIDEKDRGHTIHPLTYEGYPLGTLVLVGIDPYEETSTQNIALTALSQRMYEIYEREETQIRQQAAENRAESLAGQLENEQKLFAAAQHEVGNPLAVIDGYLGLLRMNVLDETEQQEALEAMAIASKRIRLISQSLLTLAAAERGNVEASLEDITCSQLVLTMRVEYGYMFEGSNITVVNGDEPGTESTLRVDTLWLRQIVDNLVSNSAKATRSGGAVEVTVTPQGPDLVITVTDTGIGISEQDLERVNQAFYRAKTMRAERVPGIGLGLYIVTGLVALHNGTFNLESTLGKGTTATVTLHDSVVRTSESSASNITVIAPAERDTELSSRQEKTAN